MMDNLVDRCLDNSRKLTEAVEKALRSLGGNLLKAFKKLISKLSKLDGSLISKGLTHLAKGCDTLGEKLLLSANPYLTAIGGMLVAIAKGLRLGNPWVTRAIQDFLNWLDSYWNGGDDFGPAMA